MIIGSALWVSLEKSKKGSEETNTQNTGEEARLFHQDEESSQP